jgi:hypothetical protein
MARHPGIHETVPSLAAAAISLLQVIDHLLVGAMRERNRKHCEPVHTTRIDGQFGLIASGGPS